MTQRQRFRHHFTVVPFAGIWPLIGGAGSESTIHFFTQRAVIAIGQHRQIAWHIQRQQPAFLLFGLRHRLSLSQRAFRQAAQFGLIGDQLAPAHGGVEHVVAVSGTQFGKAGDNLAIATLFFRRQANARQFEITQRVFYRLALRHCQLIEGFAFFQATVSLV
ncbi:hypothetical protein D3C80_1177270 [compost metagenome]